MMMIIIIIITTTTIIIIIKIIHFCNNAKYKISCEIIIMQDKNNNERHMTCNILINISHIHACKSPIETIFLYLLYRPRPIQNIQRC